jgi:hypothetical protein
MSRYTTIIRTLALAALLVVPSFAFAQITLGTAQTYAVLGGTTVTNTNPTNINGNLGVSPGSAVTGFPPGVVTNGAIHVADANAAQAQTDLTTAYNIAAGLPCGTDLTGQDLGGLVLTSGVYCFNSSAGLTGNLTLNMQGDPNAFFVFKIGSTLTVASAATVTMINAAGSTCPTNVFWQVGSSATFGTGSQFKGNILSLASITLTTGAQLSGRALARNGAVTLDTNTVGLCGAAIVCPAITVNPTTLPTGALATPYNQLVSASGATGPVTFAITSGALPNGLSLNTATGAITGTPLVLGTFNFTITATDTNGCFGSRPYQIVITALPCPTITVNPPSLPAGSVGFGYNQTITASGGQPPYVFTVVAGALPPGLTLNSATGAISGVPTTAGTFNPTIRASDANLCNGVRDYTIPIALGAPVGGPTLDWRGLSAMMILLLLAGLYVMNRS